jgi:hypothetical protein
VRKERGEGQCLSGDEIAAYVDGAVKPGLRKRIEEHILSCSSCLHSVAELKQLVSSERRIYAPVPAATLARAADMIARHISAPCRLDVSLALKDGLWRILETTGKLLLPGRLAPVQVRAGRRASPSPRVSESLGGYRVTLELVPSGEKVEPRLVIVDESSSEKPDGVKAKLVSGDSSQTRYSRAGKIAFSPVGAGPHAIEIERIGRINLNVR